MNWKRILLFAGLFLLVTTGGHALLRALPVILTHQPLSLWWMLVSGAIIYGTLFFVGFQFGKRQQERVWTHTVLICLLGSTISILTMILFVTQIPNSEVMMLAVISMGVQILSQTGITLAGVAWSRRSGRNLAQAAGLYV